MATPAPALRDTVDSTRASNSGLYSMRQAGADTPACAFLGTGAAGLTIAVLIVTDKRNRADTLSVTYAMVVKTPQSAAG